MVIFVSLNGSISEESHAWQEWRSRLLFGKNSDKTFFVSWISIRPAKSGYTGLFVFSLTVWLWRGYLNDEPDPDT